jgi:hypothetical protein
MYITLCPSHKGHTVKGVGLSIIAIKFQTHLGNEFVTRCIFLCLCNSVWEQALQYGRHSSEDFYQTSTNKIHKPDCWIPWVAPA